MKRLAIALALLIASFAASFAQNVTVIGPITPGDCPQFSSTTVIKDSGFNCNGGPGGTAGGVLSGTYPNPSFSTSAFANPTATAGPTAVPGSALLAMRSDAAPAVQKGTNAQFGIVEGDGTTIDCSVTPGICIAKINGIFPTPTRAGDIVYWNGSNWVTLAGNNSGTQALTENSSGIPTWASASGITLTAGTGIGFSSGATCTTSCTVSNSGVVTIKKQVFTATGAFTYTPSTGMIFAIVECIGAGGGGGGIANTAAGQAQSAGGGGSGADSRVTLTAAQVGVSQSGTIGVGGTAGANTGGNGGTGGDTSLGALCVAKGGTGGTGGSIGTGGAGGLASGGTGDFKNNGNNGGGGSLSTIVTVALPGGKGADGPVGNGPSQVYAASVSIVGANGNGCGAGANGGISWNGGGAVTGGVGSGGCVYIQEFATQ